MDTKRPPSKQPIPENAKTVFKGEIFEVLQWPQSMFDGTSATFEKLRRPDTAIVIPVLSNRQILIAHQEQPGKPSFMGFLGGRVNQGEDPLVAAKRELREESGYSSGDWTLLLATQPVSKIDWAIFIFVARNCEKTGDQDLDSGEKIAIQAVNFDQFFEMVTQGQLDDPELRIMFLEAKLNPAKMATTKKLILG